MPKTISLSEYVKKRNGVALGAPHSLRNMLSRSFGAGAFDRFWQYWNPIWGYYLCRQVMKPISLLVPVWFAIIVTFIVSGLLHDLAISIVKWQIFVFFTPWFGLMSLVVLATKFWRVSYRTYPWGVRACINLIIISGCFLLTDICVNWLIAN